MKRYVVAFSNLSDNIMHIEMVKPVLSWKDAVTIAIVEQLQREHLSREVLNETQKWIQNGPDTEEEFKQYLFDSDYIVGWKEL